MKKWDIYVMGDINIDLMVPGVEKLPPMGTEMVIDAMPAFVGGGAALFAMGTAKLGMKTVFQGKIGRDLYGAFIRENLRKTGVDDCLLLGEASPTGISICFTGPADRCFVTFPGTNEGIDPGRMDLEKVRLARHVHLTGYQGAADHEAYRHTLTQLRAIPRLTISMDVGWDPSGLWPECIYELFPLVDVMLMNEEECLHYTRCGTAAEGVRRIGEHTGTAVVKLGAQGSIACRQGKVLTAGPYPVRAVDPTGAGDSFNAGFITGFLQGQSLQACLRMGNACGAMSVTAMGGNTAFPTKGQLTTFLRERYPDGSDQIQTDDASCFH